MSVKVKVYQGQREILHLGAKIVGLELEEGQVELMSVHTDETPITKTKAQV